MTQLRHDCLLQGAPLTPPRWNAACFLYWLLYPVSFALYSALQLEPRRLEENSCLLFIPSMSAHHLAQLTAEEVFLKAGCRVLCRRSLLLCPTPPGFWAPEEARRWVRKPGGVRERGGQLAQQLSLPAPPIPPQVPRVHTHQKQLPGPPSPSLSQKQMSQSTRQLRKKHLAEECVCTQSLSRA